MTTDESALNKSMETLCPRSRSVTPSVGACPVLRARGHAPRLRARRRQGLHGRRPLPSPTPRLEPPSDEASSVRAKSAS